MEIIKIKYPKGFKCSKCSKKTIHYKVKRRASFLCAICRSHIYPLAGTLFEKSSTPLRLWFFAIFLMLKSRGEISARQLQTELGVTYKTAWRTHKMIYELMKKSKRGILKDNDEKVFKWTFLNALELKVVDKKEPEH